MTRIRRKGKSVSSKTVRNHIQLEKAQNDRLGKVTFDEALAIIDFDDNDTESDTCPGVDHEENPEGICPDEEITPIKGSCIVNVGCIARQLNQGCVVCGDMLSIRNVQSEHIKGLASVWHILCEKCGGITNYVHTFKWHTQKDSTTRKKWSYNVNTKVVVGKYFHQESITTYCNTNWVCQTCDYHICLYVIYHWQCSWHNT